MIILKEKFMKFEISKKLDYLFEEDDSSKEDSRASPEIWKNKTNFSLKDFEQSIENLLQAVKNNDIEEMNNAISRVGANCGKCHESFRLPKKIKFNIL